MPFSLIPNDNDNAINDIIVFGDKGLVTSTGGRGVVPQVYPRSVQRAGLSPDFVSKHCYHHP